MTRNDEAMRFLGFALASADLLFEIDPKGVITLAVGAVGKVTGSANTESDCTTTSTERISSLASLFSTSLPSRAGVHCG